MIKAIIFDYFGVIRPDILIAVYRKFGGDPEHDAQFIHDTLVAANRGMIPNSRAVFSKHLGVSEADFMAEFRAGGGNDQELLDFIQRLRSHYKTGLLSNVSKGRLTELFEPGALETYFDAAVASGDIGYAKPEPEAYEIVAERLGVRLDECIFTDDQAAYCEAARAVGMQAIVYKDFAQFQTELDALLQR